ncbi:MAG: hypothetical protein ACK4KV_09610 [Rhodocyclaceae bacterium]
MNKNTAMMWAGQGPVMIGTYDPSRGSLATGNLVDLYRVGCVTSQLNTSVSITTTSIKESCTGKRLTIAQREDERVMTVSLAMVQFSGRTLAAALFGEAVDVAGGTVTGEVLPELTAGDYFTLRHPRVDDLVIVDSTAGTPLTYVEDTHYEIEDAGHARMKLLAHPVSHVVPLLADYSYGGYVNIAAFSESRVERGIIFNGVNQDGQKGRLIIPRIALTLDGDFGWVGEEEATLTMSGEAMFVPELESDGDYGGFARVNLFDNAP